MEKPAFLCIGILLCLVFGISLTAEARSLMPKYTKIEIEEEAEPIFIYIDNKHDDKTYKLKKYIAKIDKRLETLEASYKQLLVSVEDLSDTMMKSVIKNFFENIRKAAITQEMQEKIQEIESNVEILKTGVNFQGEGAEESENAQNMVSAEEVESNPEISEDPDHDTENSEQKNMFDRIFPYLVDGMEENNKEEKSDVPESKMDWGSSDEENEWYNF